MTEDRGLATELDRVRRVSDMLCSAHANLRDSYQRRAFTIDILTLGLSTWLVAMAFVELQINFSLTPYDFDSTLWIGLLAVGTFFLTIVQLRTDWKGQSNAHQRTFEIYAKVKREAGYLLAGGILDEAGCRRVFATYDMASAVGVEIPEPKFLALKRKHKIKITISKHLDLHPSASILLTRIRFWLISNFAKSRGR